MVLFYLLHIFIFLTEEDRFLRDYITKHLWREENPTSGPVVQVSREKKIAFCKET